jgi:hypothetical protein
MFPILYGKGGGCLAGILYIPRLCMLSLTLLRGLSLKSSGKPIDYGHHKIEKFKIGVKHSTINCTSFSFSALPFAIPCHFEIHPRQQVAVACWAMNNNSTLTPIHLL